MSNVNIPLLRKAVEWVEEQAQQPAAIRVWEQRYYRLDREFDASLLDDTGHTNCGTTYCVAGKVCIDEHGPDWHPYDDGTGDWDDEAGRLLGTGEVSRQQLFHAFNTAEDVRRIAEELAGERL